MSCGRAEMTHMALDWCSVSSCMASINQFVREGAWTKCSTNTLNCTARGMTQNRARKENCKSTYRFVVCRWNSRWTSSQQFSCKGLAWPCHPRIPQVLQWVVVLVVAVAPEALGGGMQVVGRSFFWELHLNAKRNVPRLLLRTERRHQCSGLSMKSYVWLVGFGVLVRDARFRI
mmetsp:Transcript_36964/g.98561  ORF Transcript_36964/g.98561 Transcript_36964/m.98561 type:complete len:174 (+) Transcript_36964:77-598(+)